MMSEKEIEDIRDSGKVHFGKGDFVEHAHEGRDPLKYYKIKKASRGSFQTPQRVTYSSLETALVATKLSEYPLICKDIAETLAYRDIHEDDEEALQHYVETDAVAGGIRMAFTLCHLELKDIYWDEILSTTLARELQKARNIFIARRVR